jgi:hypothetical protein
VFGKCRFAEHMPYGRGITVLFSGQSGTGKTMAAHTIVNALMRIVYSVDLAQSPSKYIGETNKNFEIVFAEAERSGAVTPRKRRPFLGVRSSVPRTLVALFTSNMHWHVAVPPGYLKISGRGSGMKPSRFGICTRGNVWSVVAEHIDTVTALARAGWKRIAG